MLLRKCCQVLTNRILPLEHYIFIVGLVLLPFIYWPFPPLAYETPRVWFFIFWADLLLGIQIYKMFKKRRFPSVKSIIPLYLLIFLLLAFVSSLFGADLTKSIFGNFYRFDGLITFAHLVALYLYIVLFWKPQYRWFFTESLTVGFTALLCLATYEIVRLVYSYPLSTLPTLPFGLTFGHPNYLAGYLLLCLPILFYNFSQSSNITGKFTGFFTVISIIILLVITRSIASLFLCGCFLISQLSLWKKIPTLMLIITWVSIITLVSLGFYQSQKPTKWGQDYRPENRSRIYIKTLYGGITKPIFGWGWANVDYAFDQAIYPFEVNYDIYLDKAHSLFLEIFVTTGIVGLVSYWIFGISIFTVAIENISRADSQSKNFQRMMFFILILFFLHANTNITSIGEDILFYVTAGMVTKENELLTK
jgi:hypothetical protein